SIVAEPLEAFVSEAVLYRLDTAALADALTRPDGAGNQSKDLLATLSSDEAQLEDLALVYARKQISLGEWLTARKEIEARISDQRRRLERTDHRRALREVAGQGDALRQRWPEMNLDQRCAIIRTLLDRLVVSSARVHGRIQ